MLLFQILYVHVGCWTRLCRPFDVWQGSEYASEAYRQIMKNTRLTTNLLKISKYIRFLLNFILNPEPHHDI